MGKRAIILPLRFTCMPHPDDIEDVKKERCDTCLKIEAEKEKENEDREIDFRDFSQGD